MNDPKQILKRQQEVRDLAHQQRLEQAQAYFEQAIKHPFDGIMREPQARLADVVPTQPNVNAPTKTPDVTGAEIRLRTQLEDERIMHAATKNEVVRLKQKLNQAYASMNEARDAAGDLARRNQHLQTEIGHLNGVIADLKAKAKR